MGERRPPNILWGNAVPPNDIRTRGNGDIVAFPQTGLQRNAKSMVSWFSGKSLKLLPPDKGGEGSVEKRRESRGGETNEWEIEEEDFRAFPQFQICHYTNPVGILRGGKVGTRTVQDFIENFIITLTFYSYKFNNSYDNVWLLLYRTDYLPKFQRWAWGTLTGNDNKPSTF